MLQFHYSTKSDCTIAVKEIQRRLPYGVVDTKDSQVTRIVEKPVHSHFINAGIYVINKSRIDMLGKSQFLEMPDLLTSLIERKNKVSAFAIHEYWLDIGRIDDFETAQEDYNKHFQTKY